MTGKGVIGYDPCMTDHLPFFSITEFLALCGGIPEVAAEYADAFSLGEFDAIPAEVLAYLAADPHAFTPEVHDEIILLASPEVD